MSKRIPIGTRVEDRFLGAGTVVERITAATVGVLYDVRPPLAYNMGCNPALAFECDLKIASSPTVNTQEVPNE